MHVTGVDLAVEGMTCASCAARVTLATPTAILTGTGRGAQLGILIKGPEVLSEPPATSPPRSASAR